MVTLDRRSDIVFTNPLPIRISICGATNRNGWTSLAKDFVEFAACISMADRMFRRSRQTLGGRTLRVRVPVRELARWKHNAPLLSDLLNVVTNDNWEITFARRSDSDCGIFRSSNEGQDCRGIQRVMLFSGGLDSAVAAATVAKKGLPTAFVTHYVRCIRRQEQLLSRIYGRFDGSSLPPHFQFYIAPIATDGIRLVEHSRRSRPFLFASLAGATAIATGACEVCIGENGPMALNLPLDSSKVPTRHAHSQFLVGMEELVSSLAGIRIRFFNPFELTTKGSMAKILRRTPELALATISCWNQQWAGRGATYGYGHCGYCLPCLVRKASLQSADITIPNRHFDVNPQRINSKRFNKSEMDKIRGPLRSLGVFVERIDAARSLTDFMIEFCEVIDTQPTFHTLTSDQWFSRQYSMMKLFAKEMRGIL